MTPGVDPELVWSLFPRLLGAVYLIAFASLAPQLLAIAGSRGITPVDAVLAPLRRDFPPLRRFLLRPTLLWLAPGDGMLRALLAAGILGAAAAVAGGAWAGPGLLVCWVAWLSLDAAVDLLYPWDCLLFEAGFLALFLPAAGPPPPVLVFAHQLLLVRLILGFGKTKFLGSTRKDRGYLREFLLNQPIPNPVGWLAHRLPGVLLRAGIAFLFLVEVVLPLLAFAPGWPRLAFAAGVVMLMAGIQVAGNFGYFNLLAAVLCVPLLDAQTTLADLTLAQVAAAPLTHAVVAAWALLGATNFPFNSWCTQAWPAWPVWNNVRNPGVRALVATVRTLGRFRLSHAFGVFPPQTTPAVKFAPVVEATRDGVEWREYETRYHPTHERSAPRFVAPHHPRWDHFTFYDGTGLQPGGFTASLIAAADPYHYHPWSPAERLLQRVLEGRREVLAFFRRDPFADGGGPPVRARVALYMLEPTTPAERRETGRWWRRTRLTDLYPERTRDDARWQHWPADPLRFHWDDVFHREAAPAVAAFRRTAGAGELAGVERAAREALAAVGRPAEGVLEEFWAEFVPLVRRESPADLAELPAAAAAARTRFGEDRLGDFERLANLFATALADRHRHRIFGPPRDYLPLPSYFHFGMLCHALLLQGRAALERALGDESFVEAEAARVGPAEGLWLLGVVRHETLRYHVRRYRYMYGLAPQQEVPGLPGFVYLLNWLATQMYDPAEEVVPLFTRDVADGGWRVAGVLHPAEPVRRRVRVPALWPPHGAAIEVEP